MYVIAIVGAGGKTSRIKNLTKEYVQSRCDKLGIKVPDTYTAIEE